VSFADFEQAFGTAYETFYFYTNTDNPIEIKFDKKEHKYYRVDADGNMILLMSGSQVGHIVDKSMALVPWACKMMAQKIFATVPKTVTKSGVEAVIMPYADFEKAIMAAKTAHKDRLEDAGNVGHATHDWIERYIQALIDGKKELAAQLLSCLPLDERAANGCRAMLDWAQHHNVRFLETEKKIFSRDLDVSGTLDGKALTDSCKDLKCCPEAFQDRLSLIDWKTSNHLYLEYIMQVGFYWQAELEEHGTVFDDAWVIRLGKEDGEFDPWHLDTGAISRGQKAFRSALDLNRDLGDLEEYEKARKDAISVLRKAEAEVARQLKRAEACAYSGKFKGSKYPTCNDGNPCRKCVQIWLDRQVEKNLGWVFKTWEFKQLGAGDAETRDVFRTCFDQSVARNSELLASLVGLG
jgi:hypothetical protein